MDTTERVMRDLRSAADLRIKDIPANDKPLCETELRQMQPNQTRHNLPLSDLALKKSSQGVLILDADQKIQSVNAGFEVITGRSQAEMLGKPWESFPGGNYRITVCCDQSISRRRAKFGTTDLRSAA